MARLTRAERQLLNRQAIMDAAAQEFAVKGFEGASIEAIAEGAELTRGALYSNFDSKRALYFEVMAEATASVPMPDPPRLGTPLEPEDVLAQMARDFLGAAAAQAASLTSASTQSWDFLGEILAQEATRLAYGQLLELESVVLARALERVLEASGQPVAGRLLPMATAGMAVLFGGSMMTWPRQPSATVELMMQTVRLVRGIPPAPPWSAPAGLPKVERPADRWLPVEVVDRLRGRPGQLGPDAVVAVMGISTLSQAEDALRAHLASGAPGPLTIAVVTEDRHEMAPFTRLIVTGLGRHLCAAVPTELLPELQVVCDETGAVAAAAGVDQVGNDTNVAVRVSDGVVIARAEGEHAAVAVLA